MYCDRNQDINYRLICAVHEGRLKEARKIINSYGLSYSQDWSGGYVLLRDALRNKHAAVAKLLLTSGSKVNSKSIIHNSTTPLHYAIKNADIEIVEMILDQGGTIDARNEYGETPLYYAIVKKKMEVIELLLKHGANVNARCNDGVSPLHFAIKYGDKEIVEMILDKGGSIHAQNKCGRTALYYAIQEKKMEVIELLIKHGANVNDRCNDGVSPLHFAVKYGDKEIVEMILDKGCSIDAQNKCGRTALYYAIQKKKIEVIELLIKHGADVNARSNDGVSPLHFAVMYGEKKIVEMILDKGGSIDAQNKCGRTALYYAIQKNKMAVIELLIKHGADVNARIIDGIRQTPLHFAVENGTEDVIALLLSRGANADVNGEDGIITPLHIAAKNGRKTVVILLLQHGGKVDNQDKDGKTVLHLAVENQHLMITKDVLKYCPDINNQSNRSSLKTAVHGYDKKIVEALLEYGITVNSEDANNPKLLHTAVEKGYVKIVEDLLKYGADVNMLHYSISQEGATPLHGAAKNKQEEIAKLLISYGADINAQDKSGKNPIFYAIKYADLKTTKLLLDNTANVRDNPELLNIAVKNECIEIVEALLQHDVDVNASDTYGKTALHFTVTTNEDRDSSIKVKMAKLLLNKGANVNAEKKDGTTALHIATKKGYKDVVKVLLECGAKVDSKKKNMKSGITPLHLGAQKGYREIIETLLKFGADVNSRDKYGRTALHMACNEGHMEVVSTLLEYGSDVNITCTDNLTPLDKAFRFFMIKLGFLSFCKEPVEVLRRHIIKLKTANLYVCKKNLLSIDSYKISDFQDECEKEIASIKSEKINNTNISFYDILAKGTSSLLAIYMRNENIVQVLKSDDYKTKFPMYASMIENNFRKGMERKELIEQGNQIFHVLFNNFPELPHDCTEKIFSYLSDKDLRNLMDVCKASYH